MLFHFHFFQTTLFQPHADTPSIPQLHRRACRRVLFLLADLQPPQLQTAGFRQPRRAAVGGICCATGNCSARRPAVTNAIR